MTSKQTEIDSRKRSRAGKKTYMKIVECAHDILSTESYEQLTMQGIAKRLEIRLSNVQYYFKSRAELINALLEYNNRMYFERWNETISEEKDDAEQQFAAFVTFNLADIKRESTRHFFIQLWPLLSTVDEYSGKLLKEMYEPQMTRLTELIINLSPGLSESEARVRAELIASMLEGFMVTTPATKGSQQKDKRRDELTMETAFRIATACP